jgi:hypothetical protein
MRMFAVLAVLAVSAVQTTPGRDALSLGRTSDRALYDAFNAGYQLSASDAVSRAEIITEFRRAVLIVREHADQGEYGFTERDLEKALAPWRGLVTIVIELRLHPLNTYTQPPKYNFYIRTGPGTAPLAPANFSRRPIYAVAVAAPGTPVTGVRLEGTFSVADISNAAVPVIIVADEQGNPLWESRLDLSRFR